MNLARYDPAATRVFAPARDIPYAENSPAKLVPGYRYNDAWTGPNEDRQAMKIWHWPVQAIPVLLRTFPGVTTDDPLISTMLASAHYLNGTRTQTIERARALADGIGDEVHGAGGRALRKYQRDAFVRTLRAGGSRGLFHQTGTGKTITTAALLECLTMAKDGMRVSLVVCPLTLIESAWLVDLVDWFPDLPTVDLTAIRKKGKPRELAVANCVAKHGRCVALVNYETLRTDASVRKIASGAFVVFDEASKCKTYKSSISVIAREIAPTFRGCVLLSGTPAPNGHEEYWPLAKILAPAAGYDPFPGGYSAFAQEFCKVKTFERRREPGKKNFAGFEFRDELASRIHERLSPICEWLKKDDCLDLPEKVFQRVPVALSKETAGAYEEMRDLMSVSIGNRYGHGEQLRAKAVNALAQMMKLRQITSGYVPAFPEQWVDGSAEDAKVLVPLGREKIDWLIEHCETVGERIVVWTQFVFEAARYAKELAAARAKSKDPWIFSCATITGETRKEDRHQVFQDFVASRYQVLIAHPGVAQWGVSFPGVSLAGYASLSYSLQEFAQSQDRIHGIGRGDASKHSTFYMLVATANGARTIDDSCLDVLEGKREALDLVFDIDRERRGNGFVSRDVGARIDG